MFCRVDFDNAIPQSDGVKTLKNSFSVHLIRSNTGIFSNKIFFVVKVSKFSTIVNLQESLNKCREFPLNLGLSLVLFNMIQLYNYVREFLFTHANMPDA